MVKKLLYLIKCQLIFLLNPKQANEKIWLFSSVDNNNFNYNSKYLFLYIKNNHSEITPYYVINDDEVRRELGKMYGEEYFIETRTISGIKKALRAKVWFVSAGLPVYGIGLKKKYDIINLWHGIPLKKIALLEEKISEFQKIYFKKIFSDNYKYILTSSKELVSIMARSFGVEEEKIKIWGQPRNDAILECINREAFIRKNLGRVPEYTKIILYAPTYRDKEKTKIFPFQDFNREKMEKFLEEHKILMCFRMHLNETEEVQRWVGNRIFDISSDVIDDITGFLSIFDMLITDYSSIYIDYLLLNRPIIFVPYDKNEYLKERGMNFKYDDVTPGKKPDSMETFLEALEDGISNDSHEEERREINKRFNEVQYPCSEKIYQNICKMEEEQL